MRKVGYYIRVSTDEQAENPEGSIKNQEERLKKALELKNADGGYGEFVSLYCDPARSGKDTKRPELQRLLKDIRLKKINAVMVTELSRISRSIRDFSEIWDLFKAQGCEFISLRENFDTSSASGELVLFITANLAQFERRQVSERVTANMNERASRGLYNGGPIALGYKLDQDRRGHLAIDDESVETVRKSFEVFLRERSLSRAARWLNDHGYSPKRKVEGGGLHQRLSHFTVDNLHHILQNRIYRGVQIYRVKGEIKEVKAVWGPIIDDVTFARVQKKLKSNNGRAKPVKKIAYLLTGITHCATCGDHMPGKSAHGNSGKVAYHEHSWQTKKNSTLSKHIFKCQPSRVPAKILEELVMSKVRELVTNDQFVKDLLSEAKAKFQDGSGQQELERCRQRIYGLSSQLEALAEKIAHLPVGVPPEPLYRQMTKINELKLAEEKRLPELKVQSLGKEEVAGFLDYKTLQDRLRELLSDKSDPETIRAVLKRLIQRIDVGTDFVEIKYIVGKSDLSLLKMDLDIQNPEGHGAQSQKIFRIGSQSLTYGAPGRT